MNIILSIHPKWAKLIYEGNKTVEWRKSQPLYSKFEFQQIDKVFIYETTPVCRVTGYFILEGFRGVNLKYDSGYNQQLMYRGCVSHEELLKYQGGLNNLVAWLIEQAVKFDSPKPLEEFGLKRPPQSWYYTEVDV